MYDPEGKVCGETEIPNDVMGAAARLENWLREQPIPTSLFGIGIIRRHFPYTMRDQP